MTSIKNDAFVIGTAAVGAAAANVAAQNAAAIKAATSKVATPVADAFVKTAKTVRSPQTYKDAAKATTSFAAKEFNAAKSFLNYLRGLKAEAIMKDANEAKAAILAKNSAFAGADAAEYFAKHGITFPKKEVKTFAESVKKGLNATGKTISGAFGSLKDGIKGFFQKATDRNTYTQILAGIKEKAGFVKDEIKNSGFVKGTNWKTVGKYAGVAAAVALAAVVAKRIYNAVTTPKVADDMFDR